MARINKPQISLTGSISESAGPLTASVNPLTQTAGLGVGGNLVSGGDVTVGGSVGVGVGAGGAGLGVTPSVQFGQGQGNQMGASLGGTGGGLAGGVLGGPLGAAAGSAIGSAAGSLIGGGFNKSQKNAEHGSRDSFINQLRNIGFLTSDYTFSLPDGTVASFQGGSGQLHGAKDPNKLVGMKRDQLYGFESDYTNDLDYIAAMGGITLSRFIGGGKNKAVDQVGNLIGNQALGKLGYGQDFTPDNFNVVIDNLRAMYAQSGIKSKDEFLALANQGYAQTRFNDTDHAVFQQVADMVFDKDFGKASTLMAGRQKGLEVAAKTPVSSGRKKTMFEGRDTGIKGGVYAPIISFEEAMHSVQPAVDYYRQQVGKGPRPSSLQNFVNDLRGGADIIKGVGGLYQAINQLSNGGISNFLGLGNQGSELSNTVPFDFGAGQPQTGDGFSLGTGDELQLDTSNFDLGVGGDSFSGDSFNLDSTLNF